MGDIRTCVGEYGAEGGRGRGMSNCNVGGVIGKREKVSRTERVDGGEARYEANSDRADAGKGKIDKGG